MTIQDRRIRDADQQGGGIQRQIAESLNKRDRDNPVQTTTGKLGERLADRIFRNLADKKKPWID